MNEPKAKKIVVTCPHCLNTIGREYPDLDGHYEVVHHTQLLAQLLSDKKLIPVKTVDEESHLSRSLLPRPSQQDLRPTARVGCLNPRRETRRNGTQRREVSAAVPVAHACGWKKQSANASPEPLRRSNRQRRDKDRRRLPLLQRHAQQRHHPTEARRCGKRRRRSPRRCCTVVAVGKGVEG